MPQYQPTLGKNLQSDFGCVLSSWQIISLTIYHQNQNRLSITIYIQILKP
jgi:hypothetical protein